MDAPTMYTCSFNILSVLYRQSISVHSEYIINQSIMKAGLGWCRYRNRKLKAELAVCLLLLLLRERRHIGKERCGAVLEKRTLHLRHERAYWLHTGMAWGSKLKVVHWKRWPVPMRISWYSRLIQHQQYVDDLLRGHQLKHRANINPISMIYSILHHGCTNHVYMLF